MKYFSIYVLILICIILFFSLYTTYKSQKEGFDSKDNNNVIVLLGDSVFKNNSYVPQGKSIEDILNKKIGGKFYCYAMNNSKTYEIQSQINKIPLELNNEHTTIFLSAGGNDILDKYVEGSNANLNELDYLNTIFGSYKNLVKAIKTRMNKSKLVILDVYYPTSTKYLPYKNIISEWNKKIYDYAKQNHIELLKVSALLTKPTDFALDIEPSESGGEKLAEAIHSF